MRFLFVLIFIFPLKAWTSPAEEPEEKRVPILDTVQSLFGGRMNFAANRLDSFFATQRADDELGRSRIRIRETYSIRERSLPNRDTQIRFNLRLPHLEEKFHVQYFKAKKAQGHGNGKKGGEAEEEEGIVIMPSGERLDTKWLFRSDIGVSVALPPTIFARARLRKSFVTGSFIHRFVEQLAWASNTDWEQTTSLDSDYSFSDNVLFRFSNLQSWKIIPKKVTTSHGPSILQRVTDDDAFSYNFRISNFLQHSGLYLTNYTFSVDYRRNLYKQWLFLDIIPGLDFPKDQAFRRTPFGVVQIEVLLGNI